jgi:hypothetical protein
MAGLLRKRSRAERSGWSGTEDESRRQLWKARTGLAGQEGRTKTISPSLLDTKFSEFIRTVRPDVSPILLFYLFYFYFQKAMLCLLAFSLIL